MTSDSVIRQKASDPFGTARSGRALLQLRQGISVNIVGLPAIGLP